jgi:four helix bundle protein
MKKEYDLEERTASFSEEIVLLCKVIKQNTITSPIVSQLIRSATSVGANYCEANGASSKKDFRNKIHICKKEIQETKYWLRILATASPENKDKARELWKEAQELSIIFGKIAFSCK